jgi:hypothetical protein
MRNATLLSTGFAFMLLLAGATAAQAENAAPDALFGKAGVGNEALAKSNGKEGLSLNDASFNSTHQDNQANGAQSGAAVIDSGALANFNGVAAVVVNSGQNAVVQVNQQIIFNLY